MVDVLIQTFNEELNLPHTLESVKGWADDIYVVDSGSTDRTVEIAEQAGAKVFKHEWLGYAAQKNWALDNLPFTSPWILILDADEAVSPALRDEIQSLTNMPVESVSESGFYLNRIFIFMGRPIRHCGYFPSWNLRLFKRNQARYENRKVHEHMVVYGPTGHLKELLLHEDRRGLEHFFAKHNRYSTLEAEEIHEAPQKWPGIRQLMSNRVAQRRFFKTQVVPRLPFPWLWRLFYMYVIQLGFLDGRAGWTLCNFISTYEFLIHAKYQDLVRQRRVRATSALSIPEGQMGAAVRPQPETVRPPAVLTTVPTPTSTPGETHALPTELSRDAVVRDLGGRAPVSVVIPTLNEEKNLTTCLEHLAWADEVVVVDSGSIDRTREIALQHGAKIIDFKWNGTWPKKKNWALRHADLKHEWVLIVDADEWITSDLAEEICTAIKSDHYVGYYVNRRFIFMNAWIKHCGYYPSWNLRLIRRGHGEYEQLTGIGDTGSGDNEVHEHVVADGPVGYLRYDMLHFAFPSIHTFIEKHNRYSNWEAIVQHQGLSTGSAAVAHNVQLSRRRRLKMLSRRMPFRPTLRFLYSYLWQGGFLDGRPGYVFCRLLATYEYLSVAKYYELRRSNHVAGYE